MEVTFSDRTQPAFRCPFCKEIRSHSWENIANFIGPKMRVMSVEELNSDLNILTSSDEIGMIYYAKCNECSKITVWIKFEDKHTEMIYPQTYEYPEPHSDMPPSITKFYNEAGKTLSISVGASAALSRVTLENLLSHLGYPQNTLNNKIGAAIKAKNLSSDTEKLLDIIRHFGNDGAHAGTINSNDEYGTAQFLLESINRVVDDLITKPNRTKELFSLLPDGVLNGIKKRDTN